MPEDEPILVASLFPQLLEELVELLSGLSEANWRLGTDCPAWDVHGVALHLLDVELGNVSREHDDHAGPPLQASTWEKLVEGLNAQNEAWVAAARGISPRLVIQLLGFIGQQTCDLFASMAGCK